MQRNVPPRMHLPSRPYGRRFATLGALAVSATLLTACGGPSESELEEAFKKKFGSRPVIQEVQCVESVGKPGYTCNFLRNGSPEQLDVIEGSNGWRWNY